MKRKSAKALSKKSKTALTPSELKKISGGAHYRNGELISMEQEVNAQGEITRITSGRKFK